MKYKTLIFAITLITAQSLCTTSCSDDDFFNEHGYEITTANSELYITTKDISLNAKNNNSQQDKITKENSIGYLNMTWSTLGLPTWISQTPLSGGGKGSGYEKIDYTINPNESSNARSAVVTYEGTSTEEDGYIQSAYCTFNQNGNSDTWGTIKYKDLPNEAEVYISAKEQELLFLVTGNGTITIDTPSWIHFETTRVEPEYNEAEGTFSTVEVNAKIDANPYDSDRSGYVNIYVSSR